MPTFFRLPRRTVALAACLLLVAGCARGAERVGLSPDPRRTPGEAAGAEATPAPQARTTSVPGPGGRQPRPTPGQQGAGGASPTPPPVRAYADEGPVGANALAYLRGTHRRLVVEVDAVPGKEPQPSSLDHLRRSLAEVLDKPDGIEILPAETVAPAGGRYSGRDVRAIERRQRQSLTDDRTASIYVLLVNGSWAEDHERCPNHDECSLAVAYSASAFVVFSDAIRSAATPLAPQRSIERSVLVHEVGHLLRLVNIGYTSPRPHEDPEHRHHSRNPRSVMYWAVESSLVSQVLNGPPPDAFAQEDREDLADLKAGRL